MERSYDSTSDSRSGIGGNRQNPTDLYLKQLNKISHKIAKPTIRRTPPPPPPPPPHQTANHRIQQHLQLQNHHQQQQQQQPQQQQLNQPQQQQQPPVYNINKSDFRDVVQKLTGSPAHDLFSNPPPIQPPKPTSSRLQRIRPPPLSQVSNRPPPIPSVNHINNHNPIAPPSFPNSSANVNPNNPSNSFINVGRQISPLSPLPPFPAVQTAAESPISAYMRYLQSSTPATFDSESKRMSGLSPLAPLVSPRWNNNNLPQQPQQVLLPSPTAAMPLPTSPFMVPNSPLGFGRIPSPRSPYPLLSPSLLFSPTAGQLGIPQFPLSPRLPVLSPRWRGL